MKQQRKSIFFTSDWHIGHKKVLEFDERPFNDVEHMHESLIKRYNASVPEDGVCYHLGDVGMASVDMVRSVITRLNGIKILVLGNHDGNQNRMYNCGFDVVVYGATLYIAGEKLTLSHCPKQGVFREDTSKMHGHTLGENWHKEQKHTKFTVKDEGQFHLHGHIHARDNANGKKVKDGRQWDVGVCGNNYSPVSYNSVESWISKTIKKEKEK